MVPTRYYNLSKKCGLTSRSEVWLKSVRWLSALASLLCLATVKVMTAHLKMLCGGRCFHAAEVCEPRSSVSPSAYAVRMDVTVSL